MVDGVKTGEVAEARNACDVGEERPHVATARFGFADACSGGAEARRHRREASQLSLALILHATDTVKRPCPFYYSPFQFIP